MANEFLSELARRAPEIAFGFLAAHQGGPIAVAEFQRGLYQAALERDARARQAALDEKRRQAQAAQEARAQSAEQRAIDAAKRADEDQQMQRLQAALGVYDKYAIGVADTATDPIAAENQLLQRSSGLENAFGLPSGQLAPFIPNMAPAVSARNLQLAESFYNRAKDTFGAEAMANDSIMLQPDAFKEPGWLHVAALATGGNMADGVKPSQLRALFGPQATTATGEPATPMIPPSRPRSDFDSFFESDYLPAVIEQRAAAGNMTPVTRLEKRDLRLQAREAWSRAGAARTPGSFEDYLTAPPERRRDIEAARARYAAANRAPGTPPSGPKEDLQLPHGIVAYLYDMQRRGYTAEQAEKEVASIWHSNLMRDHPYLNPIKVKDAINRLFAAPAGATVNLGTALGDVLAEGQ
jgi:hypothetical protein